MKVSYPAIYYEEKEGGYTVFFPDFGAATCGDDMGEAVFMAKDCLSSCIFFELEDHHQLPKPTALADVDLHCNDSDDWEYVRSFAKMVEIECSEEDGL
ncbi:type II toxin-antitoxin system HicB family antitoxin [uncultured Megasphaera sp.]|uniref:type II toxin-antitoxin system HicB family antitoxin n=1 Tax=uncultured Megasphaera sp. TaxID=165188 RepID=UPI002868403E|nr:type II toxin-antitoxin system HicB family antitoxin [uncultured Megasphaera sp.]